MPMLPFGLLSPANRVLLLESSSVPTHEMQKGALHRTQICPGTAQGMHISGNWRYNSPFGA